MDNNETIFEADYDSFISKIRKLFQSDRYHFDVLLAKQINMNETTVTYNCRMDQLTEQDNPLIYIDIDAFKNAHNYTSDLLGYVFECLEMGSIQFENYTYNPNLPINEFYKTFPVPCVISSKYILADYIEHNEIPAWIIQGSSDFIKFLSKRLDEIGISLPK